jgi:hypothetical protein
VDAKTLLIVAALVWPVVVVLIGLRLGRVLRRADEGRGWLSGRAVAQPVAEPPSVVPLPADPAVVERVASSEPS